MSPRLPAQRRVSLTILVSALLAAPMATASEHPHLLMSEADMPRLRHIAGVGAQAASNSKWGDFGRLSADYNAIRQYFNQHPLRNPLPGELAAAAFLHVIDRDDIEDGRRLAWINEQLATPNWITVDPLEYVLVLDWCWYDLDFKVREAFLAAACKRMESFHGYESPVEPTTYRDRLFALGVAAAIDEGDDFSLAWSQKRSKIAEGAKDYISKTFPTFLTWRTPMPTGPNSAAIEESQTALTIEFASHLLDKDLWKEYSPTMTRWMEHYVFESAAMPMKHRQFVRDDGYDAPTDPMPSCEQMFPISAHLIAARTKSPIAAFPASAVTHKLREGKMAFSHLWRWVPIVFDIQTKPIATQNLPESRNLDGGIIMRGDASGNDVTSVWIDSGPAFLRFRQQYDAGHFLLYHGGYQTVDAGAGDSYQAVATKKGEAGLGNLRVSFDFEQFAVSSMAHNCMVFTDPIYNPSWYNTPFRVAAGQRLIEKTCNDFTQPLKDHAREVGRLSAYATQPGAKYVNLDLTHAYSKALVKHYTREFFFIAGRVLVVVDRFEIDNTRVKPISVINIPSRPTIDGEDLNEKRQERGDSNAAGIWDIDGSRWVHWREGDGSTWLTNLDINERKWWAVGGPGKAAVIPDGQFAGKTYVGGSGDSFERLTQPASHRRSDNAWYKLGEPIEYWSDPTPMGLWGRIEAEAPRQRGQQTLVSILVTDRATSETPPTLESDRDDDGNIAITLKYDNTEIQLEIPELDDVGGTITLSGKQTLNWTVPQAVIADLPLTKSK